MKLKVKLQLGFFIVVALLLIITAVAWYSMSNMSREHRAVISAEQSLSAVYLSQTAFLQAIDERNPSHFDIVLKELKIAVDELDLAASDVSDIPVLQTIANGKKQVLDLYPSMEGLKKSVQNVNAHAEQLLKAGDSAEKTLRTVSEEKKSEFSVSYDGMVALAVFNLDVTLDHFMKTRMYYRDYSLDLTQQRANIMFEAWNNTINSLGLLEVLMSSEADKKALKELTASLKEYEVALKSFVDITQAVLREQNNILERVSELVTTSKGVSDRLNLLFNSIVGLAFKILLIVAILSIIAALAISFFLNRNILKQLGADPAELTSVAKRVAHGEYDIDDGKTHVGVYNYFIEMTKEIKKIIDFSDNILRELPVPCLVITPENKLQFTNHKMLALLGLDGEPSDYYGQTSGMFTYRDDNFETAAMRAVRDKTSHNRLITYKNAKGVKSHLNTISAPLFDRNGELTNAISLWLDVTAETLNNERIAEANENMQNVARELQQVANVASETTHTLSKQIEMSGHGAEEQANRVTITATALEEMNATVLEVARSAGSTAESAANVKIEATNGSESMQACVRAMNNVRDESLKLKEEMGTLSNHANAINQIMNVISDIADQTNLLALNAAIEAARAGDAGRGFAVVADEVRKLAEKTMVSTTDVGNTINAIQKSTADNTRLVEGAVEKIENVTEMVINVGDALLGIVSLADGTADQINSIATASEEQSSTSEEITRSVEEVNKIATANLGNMQEANMAVNELVTQTEILADLVGRLQTTQK